MKALSRTIRVLALLLLLPLALVAQKKTFMNQPATHSTGDSVVVVAGALYQAGAIQRFFWGDHYRDAWTTPIKIPVMNLEVAKGGFEVLGQGGGMQTYSLKLKASSGKLYSMRSIQKDPSGILPEALHPTFIADILQDQISAAHPYGAFVLPILGAAAGIYHTNPVLYFLPDTEVLGEYQEKFGGMVMMLEEDADEDWSDKKSFGYTENAISSNSVLEKLIEENESYVDQQSVLRARLFDMWIGDWDRHEGQWRWAELEDENGNEFYRPIPEDRDNVFFKFDGFFPWLIRRKWALRKFQKFDEDIRDIVGLNFNARYFDRLFLTELTREDWLAQADSLQRRLTDRSIEDAFKQWPDDIYQLNGKEIEDFLKARREHLKEFAARYYEVLSKEVNIYGSEESEYFEVIRQSKDETLVRMYDLSDEEKDELLYERIFQNKETKEIRLYGFEKNDVFHVQGEVAKSIKIRIIGGEGEDVFTDESKVGGLKKHTLIYDTEGFTVLHPSKETKNLTSNQYGINRYDSHAFKYDVLAPKASFGFNSDDGIFIGSGFVLRKEGFRKAPFAAQHDFSANISTKTGGMNIQYSGQFTAALATLDIVLDLRLRAPNYTSNFYGFGNDTEALEGEDFFKYRIHEFTFSPSLRLREGKNSMQVGPLYEQYDLESHGGILAKPDISINELDLDNQQFLGVRFASSIGEIDNDIFPQKGALWKTELEVLEEINGTSRTFASLNSNLKCYFTLEDSHTTLAIRLGGMHNMGDAPFYKAAILGGNQGLGVLGNIRGMRRNRFSGRTAVYNNLEIRQKLTYIQTYWAAFIGGISLFVDHGKVWQPNEESDTWHRSIGGGVWVNLYKRLIISATYAHSDVSDTFDLQLSFPF